PAAPPAMAQPRTTLGMNPEQQAAARRANELWNRMMALPPNARSQAQDIRLEYKRQLDMMSPPKDFKDYWQENFDRQVEGKPALKYSDWKLQPQVALKEHEEGLKVYTNYQGELRKANELSAVVDRMSAIINHPKFESGAGTELINQGKAALRNMADLARKNGVPIPDEIFGQIEGITGSAPLREAFTALANSAVFAKLGTLGNQISEGDRNYISAAFPNLSRTIEGNKLILDYYKEVVRKNKEIGAIVSRKARELGPRLNPMDLNDAVQAHLDDPKNGIIIRDGKLTEFGQKLEDAVIAGGGTSIMDVISGVAQKAGEAVRSVLPTTPPPAATPAPGQAPAGGRIIYQGNKAFIQYLDGRIEPVGGGGGT
ncbi:hypothetical protein J2P12_08680, partial [Candidatus Bathyarchaeota archaeon]|nr:hypothetical protein [Candidatus Bathyarchaeota archaeon]